MARRQVALMATAGHVILWEFEVRDSRREAFETHYGSDGSWARLFRAAPGYIATELLNDRECEGLTTRETPLGEYNRR